MNDEIIRTKPDEACLGKTPVKSVVQVYFADRNTKLAYFNDRFELCLGDIVYVDGKLEGLRGQVVDISHNFRIKLSDYKRIIGKADTDVKGRLYFSSMYFAAFDPDVIPYEKVVTWYKAPDKEDDEYISGRDETSFELENFKGMKIGKDIIERGRDYYIENRVCYICMDGTRGRAIVKGTKAYEVEFNFEDGKISNLICDCFCSYTCKHEYAAMLQLKEILDMLKKDFSDHANGYWAVITMEEFCNTVMTRKKLGSFVME